METTTVTDLYQAAWFLINGCTVEEVECIRLSGHLACRLTFSGSLISKLSDEYFNRQAVANLYSFRQGYNQVNSLVHQAKKTYSTRERAAKAFSPSDGGPA